MKVMSVTRRSLRRMLDIEAGVRLHVLLGVTALELSRARVAGEEAIVDEIERDRNAESDGPGEEIEAAWLTARKRKLGPYSPDPALREQQRERHLGVLPAVRLGPAGLGHGNLHRGNDEPAPLDWRAQTHRRDFATAHRARAGDACLRTADGAPSGWLLVMNTHLPHMSDNRRLLQVPLQMRLHVPWSHLLTQNAPFPPLSQTPLLLPPSLPLSLARR